MGISRKQTEPVSITNESGEPEIVLEIGGLKLSMNPPPAPAKPQDKEPPARP